MRRDGPLDERAVRESRIRLLSTGWFRAVEPRLERGSRPGRVVLIYECAQRETLSVDAIHLGQARPRDLWLGAEVSDLDPFGLGFAASGGVVSSGEQTAAHIGYHHDRLSGGPYRLDVDLRLIDGLEPFVGPRGQSIGHRGVPYIDLDYQRIVGRVRIGRRLTPLTDIHLAIRGESIEAIRPGNTFQVESDGDRTPFDFDVDDGASALIVAEMGATHDSRDDPAHPSRGWRAGFDARIGLGDYSFLSLVFGAARYVRLPARHVLQIDGSVGVVLGHAPFFDRFFVGDVHPYVPARALGVNFASRRGPNLLAGTLDEQRYESAAGRVGLEYRVPLGRSDDRYGAELFVSGALIGLGSLDELGRTDPAGRNPFPFDAVIDFGLRVESEIGVMGLSVGNMFLVVDP